MMDVYCGKCNRKKQIDRNNLNNYQKKAYNQICELFDENKNAVVTIDTPSGTGKTFFLSTLAATYKNPVKYTVFRKDQASLISLADINTYTYISFNMHHFNLSYNAAIKMFSRISEDNIGELYKLIVYSKKFVAEDTNVVILDTYTIPPPAMLLLLYIVSLKSNMHLIFAGDGIQLGAIGKSGFHSASNFYLIQIFTDMTINKFATNMRTCDFMLEDKVTRFRKMLRQFNSAGDILFDFNLRYYLYCLFREKYFTEERFDTLYIAHTHRQITLRLFRFIKYLQSIGKPYLEAPFYYQNKHGLKVPLPTVRKGKFFPFLLLVEGYKYIYVTNRGVHNVVRLEKMIFINNQLDCLVVRFVNSDNRLEEIRRNMLSYYQILPTYRDWLLQDVIHTDQLWQFPLRPYILTYHATLGRTIEKENVELNVDVVYANSVYVGLCSMRHDYDIYKIHDDPGVLNYVITDYIANERNDSRYYYRCPKTEQYRNLILESVNNKGPNKYIDSIQWVDADNVNHFECKNPMHYLRIERSAYKESSEEINTPLMQIARFVKENPNVILNTIKMAPVNNFSGYSNEGSNDNKNKNKKNKNKKKQHEEQEDNEEPKRLDAYIYLKNEYSRWIGGNEE